MLQAHELRDVLHAMDDAEQGAIRPEHGGVDRTPEARLESAPLRGGARDIVLLHRHRVLDAQVAHPLERRAQVARGVGARILGIVGKDLEDVTTDDRRACGLGGVQIAVTDGGNHQVGRERQVQIGRRLEQQPAVGRREVGARRAGHAIASDGSSGSDRTTRVPRCSPLKARTTP